MPNPNIPAGFNEDGECIGGGFRPSFLATDNHEDLEIIIRAERERQKNKAKKFWKEIKYISK